eukprot:jgi/Astpho2/842/Aster-00690
MLLQVEGKPERPRLAVYRSNNNIYVQVINDAARHTLVAASTNMPGLRDELNGNGSNVAAAVLVGKKIAELCKAANIEKVCFDRGGNIYHGRVKVRLWQTLRVKQALSFEQLLIFAQKVSLHVLPDHGHLAFNDKCQ